MHIKINIKSLGKTRGIEPTDYIVSDDIETTKDLIHNLVDIEIDKYERQDFKVLSQEDINNMMDSGKISFGFKYREKEIDRAEAKKIAVQAFLDGLYAIFITETSIEDINQKIHLSNGNELTLIRLTMLSGRYY